MRYMRTVLYDSAPSFEPVDVGVGVCVGVIVAVPVGMGVSVEVPVCDGVEVCDDVDVRVELRVCDDDAVCVRVFDGVWLLEGVTLGVGGAEPDVEADDEGEEDREGKTGDMDADGVIVAVPVEFGVVAAVFVDVVVASGVAVDVDVLTGETLGVDDGGAIERTMPRATATPPDTLCERATGDRLSHDSVDIENA